jgi:hypothetical protein
MVFKTKSFIVAAVAIVVVAVAAVVILGYRAQPTATSALKSVEIRTVDATKLPERFPTDIPLEAGATTTYNYNAVNANGEYQSSREFISKKSVAQNFSFYQTALKNAGWSITAAVNDTANRQEIIFATKGLNSLNVRIYVKGGQVRVSINNITPQ